MLGTRKIAPFPAVNFSNHPTYKCRCHISKHASALEDHFDLTRDFPTYIDCIGIPNEYKLADEVAAGFENIPVIAAIFPITPNKNVDRINYIHYNVLRLSNLTRDAVEGLSEQLAPT